MNHTAQSIKRLIQDIMDDRKRYTELKALLEQQRQWILTRDTEQLCAVNERIFEIYQQSSATSRQRYTLLTQLGVPVNAAGIRSLFCKLPEAHRNSVLALWDTLEQQIITCKALNQKNGTLLNAQHETLHQLIQTSEPENWLYHRT